MIITNNIILTLLRAQRVFNVGITFKLPAVHKIMLWGCVSLHYANDLAQVNPRGAEFIR